MSQPNKLLKLEVSCGHCLGLQPVVRSMAGPGLLNLQLASEMKVVLLGTGALNSWSLAITLRGWCQNDIAVLQTGTK